jgi:hypothetical protein
MKFNPTVVVLLILLNASCTTKKASEFYEHEKPACSDSSMPEFDLEIVKIVSPDGVPLRDTIISQTVKKRDVFKPCRQYIYSAVYTDGSGSLISRSRVWMMATGKRWEFQPEKQDEISIQYDSAGWNIASRSEYLVNKQMSNTARFASAEITGAIENEREIWMHPFRSNQFIFTEVAPFPSIELPLYVGRTWVNSLTIGNGWGDWQGHTISNEYVVVGQEDMKGSSLNLVNCWRIKSTAVASFGNSTLDFLFHEQYGFVKMTYQNYKQQTLVFELIRTEN